MVIGTPRSIPEIDRLLRANVWELQRRRANKKLIMEYCDTLLDMRNAMEWLGPRINDLYFPPVEY